jgi:hypothetical protein
MDLVTVECEVNRNGHPSLQAWVAGLEFLEDSGLKNGRGTYRGYFRMGLMYLMAGVIRNWLVKIDYSDTDRPSKLIDSHQKSGFEERLKR